MAAKLLGVALTGVVLVVIGALSVWMHQPLLVPSLGSAALLPLVSPHESAARVRNTAIGQLAGVAGGFAGVFLAGANATPAFMDGHPLTFARVAAAGIGAAVTAGLQLPLRALNPAGGATALVVALGAESANAAGAGRLVFAIFLVTLLGEIGRLAVVRVE